MDWSKEDEDDEDLDEPYQEDMLYRYRKIVNQMKYIEVITNGKINELQDLGAWVGIVAGFGIFFMVVLIFIALTPFALNLPLLLFAVFGVPYIILLAYASAQGKKERYAPYLQQYNELKRQKEALERWFMQKYGKIPNVKTNY